jgi:hypothetical protein
MTVNRIIKVSMFIKHRWKYRGKKGIVTGESSITKSKGLSAIPPTGPNHIDNEKRNQISAATPHLIGLILIRVIKKTIITKIEYTPLALSISIVLEYIRLKMI